MSPMPQLWTRLAVADGSIYDADVVYFDPSSRARVILEVSIVTIGSGTSLGRGARAGLDGVNAQLRALEEERRNHDVVRRLLDEAGNNTIFFQLISSYCKQKTRTQALCPWDISTAISPMAGISEKRAKVIFIILTRISILRIVLAITFREYCEYSKET